MLIQAIALSLIATVAHCDVNATEDYPHWAILDANEDVILFWKFVDSHVTFELHGNTTGWIGMGISPGGSMAGADIVVGWVKHGIPYVTDRHGSDVNGFPPLDPEQNVELLDGREEDGWTLIKFRRQLASCESGYDLPVTEDTLKIIYAYGNHDPSDDDVDLQESDFHFQNRGVKNLYILDGAASSDFEFPAGEEHSSFDLLNDHFEIPAQKTYYNCRLHKIPEFSLKQHLVKIEPIIQKGNELLVHHILVYQCTGNVINDTSVGSNTQCYGSDMPPDFESCRFVIQAWAIGGGPIYYPSHTGYALGEEDSPKYVVVETHYDNPAKKTGIVDSSGLRFITTSQLRQYEAGLMEIGHKVSGYQHLIPPNTDSFLDYGDCNSDCLDGGMRMVKVDKLNVFGLVFHSHLLGNRMRVRHIRNTTELPYLAKDDSYDFNFQETRMLSEERVVLPGDSLQVVCDYKSKGVRTNMTVGGLDTEKEMCLSFVYYYPKIPVAFCEAAPETNTLMNYFGINTAIPAVQDFTAYNDINDLIIVSPESLAGKTVGEHLNGMEWNDETSKIMSNNLKDMRRTQHCNGIAGVIPGVNTQTNALVIDTPYVEEEINCIVTNDNATTSTTDTAMENFVTTSGAESRKRNSFSLVVTLTSLFYSLS